MQPISFNKLSLFGELNMRANLNFHASKPKSIGRKQFFDGRTSLASRLGGPHDSALTMLAQATHRTPAYLDGIIDELIAQLNEAGYIGPIPPEGVTNEQSMSGHSRMVRGLVEYTNWQRERDPQQADKALGTQEHHHQPLHPTDQELRQLSDRRGNTLRRSSLATLRQHRSELAGRRPNNEALPRSGRV